nr:nitronate monooxygenase [Chakrabartyella piscis]
MDMKELKIGDLTAKLPLVQGGMGVGISLSGLASAVAEAGGIGTISGVQIGFREPDFRENPLEANLRAMGPEIAKAKANPNNIIAINLMTAMRNYETYAKEAVQSGIDIIVSGAGLPLNLPKYIAGSNTKIMPIVSSARALNLIIKSWLKSDRLPDAVVLEGPLAGGHLGFKMDEIQEQTYTPLEDLIGELKDALAVYENQYHVNIPLIAGGGIHTRDDVHRILGLGADAVQIGSRFIGTEECDAHENYKQAFLNATAEDMRIIKSPVGLPARAIRNDFLDAAYTDGFKVNHCFGCMAKCKPAEIPFCISKYLVDVAKGDEGLVFSGANGYRINEITTVPKLVEEWFE